jgi:hypothetical protein
VKLLITLMLLVSGGLLFWLYRARVAMAFKVASFAYLALVAVNVARFSGEEENVVTFAALAGGAIVIWGSVWVAVTIITRRRERAHKP